MQAETNAIQSLCNTIIRGIAQLSLVLCGMSLILLTLIFASTIVVRLLGHNVPASDDFSVILLAGSFTLGFAYVMAENEHLSVDLLTMRLKGSLGSLVRFAILLFTIVVVGILCVGLWHMFQNAVVNGITMPSALPIPRAVPIGVVLAGALMFEAVMILRFIERLAAGGYPHPERVLEIDE